MSRAEPSRAEPSRAEPSTITLAPLPAERLRRLKAELDLAVVTVDLARHRFRTEVAATARRHGLDGGSSWTSWRGRSNPPATERDEWRA